MTEQWIGDWMRDDETGQLIDGPTMSRYEMFMLIRELRAVIHAHAQTIRDKQAVIDDMEILTERIPILEAQIDTLQRLNNGASEEVRALRSVLAPSRADVVKVEDILNKYRMVLLISEAPALEMVAGEIVATLKQEKL